LQITTQEDCGIEEYQVDHLLLLVGRNPLPNAISGRLLAKDGGTLTLIYSLSADHSSGTGFYVDKLRTWFEHAGRNLTIETQGVEEANPTSIFEGVRNALNKQSNAAKIGLNYTGGTKAMSVHAYRTVDYWARLQGNNKRLNVQFSYLDARTLRIIIDPGSPQTGEKGKEKYVGLLVAPTLKEMLALHAWTLKHDPTTKPIMPETAQELLRIYEWGDEEEATKKDAAAEWAKWLQQELLEQTKRKEKLLVSCARSPDDEACEFEMPGEKWLGQGTLKRVSLSWPSDPGLQQVTEKMKSELGLTGDLVLGNAATKCGYSKAEHFCKWLNGVWLEHHVLNLLLDLATPLSLHFCAQNVETKEVQFDMDVVAIRGYQLFTFSCSTDTETVRGGKERMKKKLFEAFIRARQLGGDEARVALVCCSTKPGDLEDEMRRDIDPEGHIRVFGRPQFTKLKEEIRCWIESQKGKEADY
jgi:hypothetical protein